MFSYLCFLIYVFLFMFSYLCFLIYMLSFTFCIFLYVLHFCRIFATALYPYLCFLSCTFCISVAYLRQPYILIYAFFLVRCAFLSHICDSPNYL